VYEFDRATDVSAVAPGRYRGSLDPAWAIADKPNGGYLLAVLTRAAITELGPAYPHPLAVSAHFLSAPERGADVELSVEPLRSGRRAAQTRATLWAADGTRCVEELVTAGTLSPTADPWWAGLPPVELPAPEECVLMPVRPPNARFDVHLMGVVEERLDPSRLSFTLGEPDGIAEVRGWARLADGRDWDPLSLLVAIDALPPATFPLGWMGWVPTIELTAYVRALPAPGPVRVRQRARLVEDGWVDELCEVWDSRGRLVAQATQLAGVRIPEGRAPAAGPPAGASP
jgi:acyl-coenzyme A thioesterase PaaI-like protein